MKAIQEQVHRRAAAHKASKQKDADLREANAKVRALEVELRSRDVEIARLRREAAAVAKKLEDTHECASVLRAEIFEAEGVLAAALGGRAEKAVTLAQLVPLVPDYLRAVEEERSEAAKELESKKARLSELDYRMGAVGRAFAAEGLFQDDRNFGFSLTELTTLLSKRKEALLLAEKMIAILAFKASDGKNPAEAVKQAREAVREAAETLGKRFG